jgi:hypothetical protein
VRDKKAGRGHASPPGSCQRVSCIASRITDLQGIARRFCVNCWSTFVNICISLRPTSSPVQSGFQAHTISLVALYRRVNYPCCVKNERRQTDSGGDEVARIGLCSDCRFMRRIESDRGAIFFLCELSATDPNYPKYPRLPVRQCLGYKPRPRG